MVFKPDNLSPDTRGMARLEVPGMDHIEWQLQVSEAETALVSSTGEHGCSAVAALSSLQALAAGQPRCHRPASPVRCRRCRLQGRCWAEGAYLVGAQHPPTPQALLRLPGAAPQAPAGSPAEALQLTLQMPGPVQLGQSVSATLQLGSLRSGKTGGSPADLTLDALSKEAAARGWCCAAGDDRMCLCSVHDINGVSFMIHACLWRRLESGAQQGDSRGRREKANHSELCSTSSCSCRHTGQPGHPRAAGSHADWPAQGWCASAGSCWPQRGD